MPWPHRFLRSLVLSPLTLLTSPSACLRNSRTPAVDSRLTAQTILGMRLTRRTAPSDVRGYPRGFRNASLRKDGTMAGFLWFKIIGIPAGITFPPGTLWVDDFRARLGTHSPRTNAPEDNLRCPGTGPKGGSSKHEFAD